MVETFTDDWEWFLYLAQVFGIVRMPETEYSDYCDPYERDDEFPMWNPHTGNHILNH